MTSSIGGYSGVSSTSLAQMRQQMFQKLDADGSGGVDETEFANGPSGSGGMDSGIASALFTAFDTDSDGSLTQDELETGFQKLSSSMRSVLIGTQESGGASGGPGGMGGPGGTGGMGGMSGAGGPDGPPPPPPPSSSDDSGSSDSSDSSDSSGSSLDQLISLLENATGSTGTTSSSSSDESDSSSDSSSTTASVTATVKNDLKTLLSDLLKLSGQSTSQTLATA